MQTRTVNQVGSIDNLVRLAHELEEPVVITQGKDECLIALTPALFEHLLFGTLVVNTTDRSTLHL